MEDQQDKTWNKCSTHIFWGEIAPCNHVVQIYENDEVFIGMLHDFVSDGIRKGEGVVVIATTAHLDALEDQLWKQGFNVHALRGSDQYIPIRAEDMLASFMVNNWPDEVLFKIQVSKVIERARKGDRKVRAFGEMVAILWAQGLNGATVHLEHLWNAFCETETFSLFCAYPKSGFTRDMHESIAEICIQHSQVISGWDPFKKELLYQPVR